jgi:hypothetical protein
LGEEQERHAVMAESCFAANAGVTPATIAIRPFRRPLSPLPSGVTRGDPLRGFVTDGYTRGGDAEPGSRCKSDTVLATVTGELEPHVATGPSGLGRRVTALDLGVRRSPASSCNAGPREMEGLC